ncbi:hypothetical protein FJ957_07985 [Mesorhizobium sp. B2-4-6]|nr:hypothetical protein FJ957_07985 [Mesorhizobium sp. B2-4-6]
MKIWLISDLHLEVADLREPLVIPEADVCIVAGDLCRAPADGMRWLAKHVAHAMTCIYVAGNHEFYKGDLFPVESPSIASRTRRGLLRYASWPCLRGCGGPRTGRRPGPRGRFPGADRARPRILASKDLNSTVNFRGSGRDGTRTYLLSRYD